MSCCRYLAVLGFFVMGSSLAMPRWAQAISTSSSQASGSCTPVTESCDGLDNDCDGQIDEDFLYDAESAQRLMLVSAGASSGGTGSSAKPYATLAEALGHVPSGTTAACDIGLLSGEHKVGANLTLSDIHGLTVRSVTSADDLTINPEGTKLNFTEGYTEYVITVENSEDMTWKGLWLWSIVTNLSTSSCSGEESCSGHLPFVVQDSEVAFSQNKIEVTTGLGTVLSKDAAPPTLTLERNVVKCGGYYSDSYGTLYYSYPAATRTSFLSASFPSLAGPGKAYESSTDLMTISMTNNEFMNCQLLYMDAANVDVNLINNTFVFNASGTASYLVRSLFSTYTLLGYNIDCYVSDRSGYTLSIHADNNLVDNTKYVFDLAQSQNYTITGDFAYNNYSNTEALFSTVSSTACSGKSTAYPYQDTSGTIAYSSGNTTHDPETESVFMAYVNDQKWDNEDLRLADDSTVKNIGSNDALDLDSDGTRDLTFDLLGNPRVMEDQVDMGTYEELDAANTDDDGDGYTEAEGDCNDADTAIYCDANGSDAEELEDDLDNDCNGLIDDTDLGAPDVDDDNDGYCEGESCSDGSLPGDCSDLDGELYPGAPEENDSVDNDCDCLIDSEDPDYASCEYEEEEAESSESLLASPTLSASPGLSQDLRALYKRQRAGVSRSIGKDAGMQKQGLELLVRWRTTFKGSTYPSPELLKTSVRWLSSANALSKNAELGRLEAFLSRESRAPGKDLRAFLAKLSAFLNKDKRAQGTYILGKPVNLRAR